MIGDEHISEFAVSGFETKSNAHASQPHDFRWQSLFQKVDEPFFLLNRQRRLLFVNQAWEKLTGMAAAEARGLICLRRPAGPEDPRDIIVRSLCCPPPEVLKGHTARVRRSVPAAVSRQQWWRIDFLPLHGRGSVACILGKITVETPEESPSTRPVPEKLVALRETRTGHYRFRQIGSKLPGMQLALEQARLASATRIPLLIQGEPGTGKEWLARIIHHESDACDRAFVALDCRRLPVAALHGVIWGEKAGGNQSGRRTLYLRGVSSLPRDLQMRLCDLIRSDEDSARWRVIGGASAEPREEIAAGRLLEEFHCALSPITIFLPPLRERRADLPELVAQMLERAGALTSRHMSSLTPEAWDLVQSYSWLGNLRELFVTLRSACVRATGERIDACHFPAALRTDVRMGRSADVRADRPISLDHVLEQAERRLILLALKKAKGNKSRAAELLSIWRPRLIRRMEALGITPSPEPVSWPGEEEKTQDQGEPDAHGSDTRL
jgi:transcriptional regulator with PAS, ATPase and Fis domain